MISLLSFIFAACSSIPEPFLCMESKYIHWEKNGNRYSVVIQLSRQLDKGYHEFKQAEISTINVLRDGWGIYLHRLPDDPNIVLLARQLRALSMDDNAASDDDKALVELVVSFVQAITYTTDHLGDQDIINKDILMAYRTPYETLRSGGCCLEKSLLAIALFRELGFGTTLFELSGNGHMAFGIQSKADYALKGIRLSGNYIYVESTIPMMIGTWPKVISGKAVDFETVHNSLISEGKIYKY